MIYKKKSRHLINKLLRGSVGEGDEVMVDKVGIRLSGMKGAEKKMKDKIGRNRQIKLNAGEKALKRIEDRLTGKAKDKE